MKKKRIFAVHLLNDFSGSPLILRQALEILSGENEVHLYTSTPSGEGALSDIPHVITHDSFYKWSPNRLITLVYFLSAQFILFCRLIMKLRRRDTVYINTLLPFGAALAAKLSGARVIYHIHEVNIKPPGLKSFLVKIADRFADRLIFVSEFVREQFDFPESRTEVIYNALPNAFVKEAIKTVSPNRTKPFTVLMLCSLKAYKGVYQFIELAKRLPQIKFQLVLNAPANKVEQFKIETNAPENCEIFPTQKDTAPFYKSAYVVANLSLTDQWLETFGMTVLEAMYYGLPVIIPSAGGPTELVTDGAEGIYADAYDIDALVTAAMTLYTDEAVYKKMALLAWIRAKHFSQVSFKKHIEGLFEMAPEVSVEYSAPELSLSGGINNDSFFSQTPVLQ